MAGEVDPKQLAEQLLAKTQGVDLVGPGVVERLTSNSLETALEAEMTEHLGL
jgi:hypothetical protein